MTWKVREDEAIYDKDGLVIVIQNLADLNKPLWEISACSFEDEYLWLKWELEPVTLKEAIAETQKALLKVSFILSKAAHARTK